MISPLQIDGKSVVTDVNALRALIDAENLATSMGPSAGLLIRLIESPTKSEDLDQRRVRLKWAILANPAAADYERVATKAIRLELGSRLFKLYRQFHYHYTFKWAPLSLVPAFVSSLSHSPPATTGGLIAASVLSSGFAYYKDISLHNANRKTAKQIETARWKKGSRGFIRLDRIHRDKIENMTPVEVAYLGMRERDALEELNEIVTEDTIGPAIIGRLETLAEISERLMRAPGEIPIQLELTACLNELVQWMNDFEKKPYIHPKMEAYLEGIKLLAEHRYVLTSPSPSMAQIALIEMIDVMLKTNLKYGFNVEADLVPYKKRLAELRKLTEILHFFPQSQPRSADEWREVAAGVKIGSRSLQFSIAQSKM